jgi:uncharacterized protein GlcG (DUF336 family)
MKPSLLSALCAAFLVSQAHAQGLLPTHRISADLANQAVAAAVAKCASQGYAVTGVLVDADGIKLGDEVVGAIGAAGAPGGDLDEACAHAGLDKIKDQLK